MFVSAIYSVNSRVHRAYLFKLAVFGQFVTIWLDSRWFLNRYRKLDLYRSCIYN